MARSACCSRILFPADSRVHPGCRPAAARSADWKHFPHLASDGSSLSLLWTSPVSRKSPDPSGRRLFPPDADMNWYISAGFPPDHPALPTATEGNGLQRPASRRHRGYPSPGAFHDRPRDTNAVHRAVSLSALLRQTRYCCGNPRFDRPS